MKWTTTGLRAQVRIAFVVWAVAAAPLPAQRTRPASEPKLDVPYVATRHKAVEGMLDLAKVTGDDYVIDLGCGDGRIVIAAAKSRKARGLGVDLNPVRVRESKANAEKAGVTEMVEFRVEDVMKTDVSRASVVMLFLLETVNVRLRPKLLAQLEPGSRVVSNSFSMRDWQPDRKISHPSAWDKVIYFWTIPAPVGGTWRWQGKGKGKDVSGALKLEQEFQAIQGKASFPDAADVPITKAKLSGRELSFTAAVRTGKQPVAVVFSGTAHGDEIRGTQQWRGGPLEGSYPWVARCKVANLSGHWQVRAASQPAWNGTLRIEDRPGMFRAVYLRDGGGPKGQSLRTLYAWGTSIRFEVAARGLRSMVFRGSLADDAGGGTLNRTYSTARTTWTAKRIAAE